ncbi:MAG: hypothetical protein HY290_30525 [Planctomycetia bacterium]|nr:hypothetical protein [Planctomycetia bacterium]
MDQPAECNELGQFHWHFGAWQAARHEFEQLLRWGQLKNSQPLCEAAWNNLAVVFREIGDAAQASICQQQAWKAAFGTTDTADLSPESLSCHMTNRANDAILAGEFRLAERLLWSALDCDRLSQNLVDEAADWGSLGIVASLTGDFDSAGVRFERAYHIHAQLGDDIGMGCDLRHLAELAMARGDFDEARRFVNRALVHFRRSGCRRLVRRANRTKLEIAARHRLAAFDPSRN